MKKNLGHFQKAETTSTPNNNRKRKKDRMEPCSNAFFLLEIGTQSNILPWKIFYLFFHSSNKINEGPIGLNNIFVLVYPSESKKWNGFYFLYWRTKMYIYLYYILAKNENAICTNIFCEGGNTHLCSIYAAILHTNAENFCYSLSFLCFIFASWHTLNNLCFHVLWRLLILIMQAK